jgi:hypothetical protein
MLKYFSFSYLRKNNVKYQFQIILLISFLITLGFFLFIVALHTSYAIIFTLIPVLAIAYIITILGLPYPFVYSDYSFFSIFEGDMMKEDITNFMTATLGISIIGVVLILYIIHAITTKAFIYIIFSYFILAFSALFFLCIYNMPLEVDEKE